MKNLTEEGQGTREIKKNDRMGIAMSCENGKEARRLQKE
jgi:hypothetical protein